MSCLSIRGPPIRSHTGDVPCAVLGAGCNAHRVRLAVDFSWREIGAIAVEGGKLRFPIAPEAPGIYRFDLGDRVYIGEADRLRRRFQHYRTAGPSQATNLRLNAVMPPFLDAGRAVTVCTVTEAQVDIDGARAALDLTRKASRLLVESAALTALAWLASHSRTYDDHLGVNPPERCHAPGVRRYVLRPGHLPEARLMSPRGLPVLTATGRSSADR
jgi:hypothetical protein